jgi:hypothetical protein
MKRASAEAARPVRWRLAVALDPVEDAAAELAPGILDAHAPLQANRRDAGA